MGPDELEFIFDLLGKVLVSGGTLLFIDFISDIIADYTGTKIHPGMEPAPKHSELGCQCPSCYDSLAEKKVDNSEAEFSEWRDAVIEQERKRAQRERFKNEPEEKFNITDKK